MNRVRLEFKMRKYWLYILGYSSPIIVFALAYLSTDSDPSLAIAAIPDAKVPVNRIPVASRLEPRNLNRDSREPILARISEYQLAYNEDPSCDDAPAYLMAIGTLRLERLSDYAGALDVYELVISRYPDAPHCSTAYYQALACYLRLEDEAGARGLLRRMSNAYSDDSDEHAYADDLLSNGISISPTK